MKTFSELVHDERSAASMARRRDQRNEEHKLTKAQREIQDACCYGLAHHVAYIEACSQRVANGELHPLEHPLAAYYAELRRDELLHAQHPATVQHPLMAT